MTCMQRRCFRSVKAREKKGKTREKTGKAREKKDKTREKKGKAGGKRGKGWRSEKSKTGGNETKFLPVCCWGDQWKLPISSTPSGSCGVTPLSLLISLARA